MKSPQEQDKEAIGCITVILLVAVLGALLGIYATPI